MTSPKPQPHTHEQRLDLARTCTEMVLEKLGSRVLAVGIYGSTAKALDGPYSDLEMHCVLEDDEFSGYCACVLGSIKASVDLLGRGTSLKNASDVDAYWAMTQSEFANTFPTHDPQGFLSELALLPFNQGEKKYKDAMRDLVVGYLYEYVAKLHGALDARQSSYTPWIMVETANSASWLFGLDNRYLFARSATMYAEALTLPGIPEGARPLFELVMSGKLDDPVQNVRAADMLWDSLMPWCEARGLEVATDLSAELDRAILTGSAS